MRGTFDSHGVLRKLAFFLAINGDQPFRYWRGSIKRLHSLHQHKHKKPIALCKRKTKKSVKSVDREDIEPNPYMRDTVGKIYGLLRFSSWDFAKEELERLPIRWDSYTVNKVLKTHPPMEKAWLFFNWVSRLKGFKHDHFTYTTMLDIFGEAGRISSMKYVFKQMQEKGLKIDAVTYTSLMHWLSISGDVDGAMKVWEEMKANGCLPTVVSYTTYMKLLFDYRTAKEATNVYREMLRSGCSPSCHTYTVLMEYLVESGKYKEALEIFSKMQEAGVQPDKAACNILVEKFSKVGETKALTLILQYMKENHLVLRYSVFLEALEALKFAGESSALLRQVNPHFSIVGEEEVSEVIPTDCDVPICIDSGLLLICLKKQNLVAIDRLLTGIIDKNVRLDSAIISSIVEANCDRSRRSGALLAFKYSVRMDVIMERNAYLSLIGILIRSSSFLKVVEIVEVMLMAGQSPGTYLSALLIYRLGFARRAVCAAKIFDLLPEDHKSTATFTALIGVYFTVGNADKGLKIFRTMLEKGIRPTLGTYNVLLAGLANSGRTSEVEVYRKEKKNLQLDSRDRATISLEEKICDLLFAGVVVS
ncbi:hypothetical protein I3843_Q036300 [Carya illinoinensis]|nr:hypothetical protein I3843_Q036300 [Carya illinoinensis]